jgi:DNA mismatch endonuclease (patch repair protein)
MADIVPPSVRSRMMAGIRNKDTKAELILRGGLHSLGFRYRLHVKNLPGKPDIVFPKHRAVLFAHGCFWHGHDCHLFVWPKSRPKWWRDKIERNRAVDLRVTETLLTMGWRVGVVWECAIKGRSRRPQDTMIESCASWLRSDAPRFETRGID